MPKVARDARDTRETSLSIIIPVLNEARHIAQAMAHLRAQIEGSNLPTDLVVVDGGSSDDTIQQVEPQTAHPALQVIHSTPGRAVQMNRGAWESTGEWLLFLHADTRLPEGFQGEIARAAEKGCRAGAFALEISGRHPLLPLLGWGATWRTRLTRIALGDQAIFCRRDLFTELDGFPPLPIMEDYVFTLRLRQRGEKLYVSRLKTQTSGRRWDKQGFWKTCWQFRRFYWRFRKEPDLNRMKREYRDVR